MQHHRQQGLSLALPPNGWRGHQSPGWEPNGARPSPEQERWGESSPSGGEGQLEAARAPKKTPGESRGCQEEVKSWEGTRSRAWESEGTPTPQEEPGGPVWA